MDYNNAINRLKNLNNMKHNLRKALGNIGIYLPLYAGMKEVLFCTYFYYMFNLFGDNNSNWKEKYFPLDGMTLFNFLENGMSSNATVDKKYIDIANEIEAVIYPGNNNISGDTILNRGLLEEFNIYSMNDDTKEKIENISNNKVNVDKVLPNTKGLLNRLLSIWKWKKTVIEGTRRKRKEDRQTPVIEENVLLDDILGELRKESRYNLPNLKMDKIKLNVKDLNLNTTDYNYTSNATYPFTVYNNVGSSTFGMNASTFSPYSWLYKSELEINNIRPNTKLSLYYKQLTNNNPSGIVPGQNSEFSSYYESGSFQNRAWDKVTKANMILPDISVGKAIHIGYKDKYDGIYNRNNDSTYAYSYLGWKPEIFLYSKSAGRIDGSTRDPYAEESSSGSIQDSPMDRMNLLDNEDFGNLGLTILVPSVVEKYMKEKVPMLDTSSFSGGSYNALREVNSIRNIETVFLVGIYPVDENNNIVYKDPIVFQFFSGEQLNEDLGLSFANYRKIKSPTTQNKVLLRKYYNIKLGQMFYRNNYSRLSTEKKITSISTIPGENRLININYENNKVGDVSKNLLYLYGRDAYMPYIGKTPVNPGQNHNITNPDDNTYIENITLPDNVKYTFSKYGNTKIAIQLYMATNNNHQMNGLEYFTKIKSANTNGGFIDDNVTESSEILKNIPGSYMGLPYFKETQSVMGIMTTKHKYFPYSETDIIDAKIPYPDYTNNLADHMSLSNGIGTCFSTEPVIIDCNKSSEYNAPWLDKRNAPYVSKVVTEDFDYYSDKLSNQKFNLMKKGIYIKIPNELSLYMLNDEYVKKYMKRRNTSSYKVDFTTLEDKEFYGRITREKYIRVIKNALLGIAVNYNPNYNSNRSGTKNPKWFMSGTGNKMFLNDPMYFDIVEDGNDLYIRIDGSYFLDLEYAGLGNSGTIKVQLIFRNEFFRSDDPDSLLNYKYVPTTGDVQLLREIAGQRIKLYRGGILAHPTDYTSKEDRTIYRVDVPEFGLTTDLSRTKEIAYKHNYTKGFHRFTMGNEPVDPSTGNFNMYSLYDNNSVYDIISIEMDYPHWLELQVNNIERSPISSMETDTNVNSLPIPINIPDLENFDFLEYDIPENLSINGKSYPLNKSTLPKLILNQPNQDDTTYIQEPIDFYRMLNFWYIFRPKVKMTGNSGEKYNTSISVETYNDWKDRILKENRDFFNRSRALLSEHSNRIIDLEDVFNIRCYGDNINVQYLYDQRNGYTKDSDSRNLYDIMVYVILNHEVYIKRHGNNIPTDKTFNENRYKLAKFGGYTLDKLLYSDWVFTYRKGDSKKIDDILRKSANDTALYLFNMWYHVLNSIQNRIQHTSPGNAVTISITDYVKNTFDALLKQFMLVKNNNYQVDIYNNIYNDSNIDQYSQSIMKPGNDRLIDFEENNNCTVKQAYEKNVAQHIDGARYNVWNKRIYKGDNRKIDYLNNKAKLRRGFRMGDKTPDNPFMGFSMPATTDPDSVPDYIHLVYCDIYWKDFDKTQSTLAQPPEYVEWSFNQGNNEIKSYNTGFTYNFSRLIEKYNLNAWKAKGKHVIFRILVDEPTDEQHKDCPENISGEYYDNKYGKGFSPNFKDVIVQVRYKYAILALNKWINANYDLLNGLLYTIELPLGIQGDGNVIIGGVITPITEISSIYALIHNDFNRQGEDLRVPCKLVYSSSVETASGELELMSAPYGWSCNNLGNRERFEEWMKYNMYGTDSTMSGVIKGGSRYGGSRYSNFRYSDNNKFKTDGNLHRGFSGVLRPDLNMDDLMKPDNFRELLYEMKTITPMYVIGYVDKEKYPEQYEMLMNEMGYKYTITSAVIEEGYLKVYYSNEGKNGIMMVDNNIHLYISLKYKNRLKNEYNQNNNTVFGIIRQYNMPLNNQSSLGNTIINTKINTGDVKMFSTVRPTINYVIRPYTNIGETLMDNSVQEAYGKNMVDDVYAEIVLHTNYSGSTGIPIKLANVNRTTDINLTDSGLLHMFIVNPSGEQLSSWFDNMYMNYIKVDDNGWI